MRRGRKKGGWQVVRKASWIAGGTLLLGLATFGHNYMTSGETELRAQVYQPLYAEFEALEGQVRSATAAVPITLTVVLKLKQSGDLDRVPAEVRLAILSLADRASSHASLVSSAERLAARESSARITRIRSEESDRRWAAVASEAIRTTHLSQRGKPDGMSWTLRHQSRGRGFDPRTGEPSAPGGGIMVLSDWIEFPSSLQLLQEDWKDFDYLYFSTLHDTWHYRITKDDLQRAGVTLREFLSPIQEVLAADIDFRRLSADRKQLLDDIAKMKVTLGKRMDRPRQLTDLIPRL